MLAKLGGDASGGGPERRESRCILSGFLARLTSEAMWTLPVMTFCRASGTAMVGVLVSGRGARRRRLHRAAHFQRARRAARAALGAVVQHRALRDAAVAVDSDGAGGHRAVSRAATSRVGLHAGRHQHMPHALRGIADCRIHGGVHVHHRHAAELGRFVSGGRFLSPLLQAARRREALRECVARWRRCCWWSCRRTFRRSLARSRRVGKIVLAIGAGTGGVYMLRWYWWRINAWSEISAMATALGGEPGLAVDESVQRQPSLVVFAERALTVTTATTAGLGCSSPADEAGTAGGFAEVLSQRAPACQEDGSPVAMLTPEVPPNRDLGATCSPGCWAAPWFT